MSEDKDNINKPEVDLSGLENMQFSPAWTPSSSYSKFARDDKPGFNKRPFKSNRPEGNFKKREDGERRPPRREFGGPRDDKGGFRKQGGRPNPAFKKKGPPPPFNFSMEVLFYPEDGPFAKLADVMKHLKRTYQLFDIAELVIEKPERFIVLAKNLPDAEGAVKPLYCAQPKNLPFDDEESARHAAIEHLIGEMFETVEVEVEAPKGNFQVVHRTRLDGHLLGAPNWHGYGAYVREYHAQKFPNMPYEKFMSTVESVREDDQLAAWIEQMKKRTVYKLKDGGETFETRAAAAAYVAEHKGEELVKSYEQVRMHGSDVCLLPFGSRIRRNLEAEWAKQKRFPIVTANNLRGRLRRAGFTIYKRGSKGFAFVSAVKRKFLLEGDTLSEKPQKIYDFLMSNQGMKAGELPFAFLGIEAPKGVSKPAPLAEEHKKQDEGVEVSAPVEVAESAPAEMSAEDVQRLKEVSNDLLWLISEGYVVEYADSSLQANPRLPRPKEKSAKTIASDAESVMLGVEDEPIVANSEEAKEDGPKAADCSAFGSECPEPSVIIEAAGPGTEDGGSCKTEDAEIPNAAAGDNAIDPSKESEKEAEAYIERKSEPTVILDPEDGCEEGSK